MAFELIQFILKLTKFQGVLIELNQKVIHYFDFFKFPISENKEKEGDGNPNSNNEIRAEDLIRKKHEPSDSNTLERNLSNINTQKYDLEFDVDPLFSKTSAKFDEAGSKGLLLNNTSVIFQFFSIVRL